MERAAFLLGRPLFLADHSTDSDSGVFFHIATVEPRDTIPQKGERVNFEIGNDDRDGRRRARDVTLA
jgi:cold shock CspA family protein